LIAKAGSASNSVSDMQLKFIKLLSPVLVFLLFPIFCLANTPFPSFPMAFWGNATADNEPLPAGTIIRAYCNNDLIGEVTMVEDGIYGHTESTKNKLLVSSCDDGIFFKYLLPGTEEQTGGVEIKYTKGFVPATTINKDLNFTTTRSCDIPNGIGTQTWDGSGWGDCIVISCNSGYHQEGNSCVVDSSGEGGGDARGGIGGGTPPASSPTAIQGDINGDSKVDKYDFALMMVAWGQTGINDSDLNNDGKVDKYDFALLMLYWTVT